ncbi:uncharacterized protein BJX67DRAFT_347111 [Aspergillus lucknowensis]|uniref:Uncharacterized protein n=1 Tax=Aspergillus lucknowensis TaxID=176173 RepID=A0ABR4LZM6_9EURO
MPHNPFHVPLRTSSMNAPTGDIQSRSNGRKDPKSRSIHKVQRILGTTDIALDHDYHRRPDESTGRRGSFLNAPELTTQHDITDDDQYSPHLRVRASSPLLGQEYSDTAATDSTPLVQLSRKLRLSGSASALYSRYSSREPQSESNLDMPTAAEESGLAVGGVGQSSEGGLNPAFKAPKGPMKDSKRKTRPPRIDLSLLFPKPQANNTPLLSPQRMVTSPSAISTTSDSSTMKPQKIESRLSVKKLMKSQPQPRMSHKPEKSHQPLNGVLHDTAGAGWTNSSMERTVRTSEMDMALEKDFEVQLTPRSTERARFNLMNFSLRSRENLQKSDSKSDVSAGSGESAQSSQRTLRETHSAKSLTDAPSSPFRFGLREDRSLYKGPMMSKKSSKSTLKNSDLSNSSVLCLSSSEDEDDEVPPSKPEPKLGKNKRDSVSTYGEFEAEICTAAAAQTTRGTLRSVERPSSSNTQRSRSSLRPVQPVSSTRSPSSMTGNSQSRRSSGIPAINEPNFFHGDPIFDQTKVPTRTPSLSQKEIDRRSRLMAVTRQEERLLEVMRQRQGKITPSIFNETVEHDRRSVASGPSRDSFYCSDTSFLRLSPGIPPPGLARAVQSNPRSRGAMTPKRTGFDSDEKTNNSASSRRASLMSSKSLPSPATTTSTTSPPTPTLPIHRFSPLPSKPPPRQPPPPVPELQLQRKHSRRRTDSSGAIVLDEASENPKESSEFPLWALGWKNENSNMTAVH